MSQDELSLVVELDDILVSVDSDPSVSVKTLQTEEISVVVELDDVLVSLNPEPAIDINTMQTDGLKVVLAGNIGPPGAKGNTGDTGPPGAASDASFQYVHDQMVASAVWNVIHNLNGFPNVTVVDSSGAQVEGEVFYIDGNHITITFNAAFGGKAYLT